LSNRNQAVNFASSTDDEGNLEPARHQVKRKRTEINDSSFNFNYSNSKCRMNSSIKKSDMESSSTDGTSILSTLRVKKHWVEPKLGWCRDEVTLQRRTKEIAKAKEKPIYIKYFSMIARSSRTKNMPKTPNKYINYSRRSWDQQVYFHALCVYLKKSLLQSNTLTLTSESTLKGTPKNVLGPRDFSHL
uniref:SLBP_RNA_bind domain-containing protein n=1 Tax=Thelazia callipaeda TaxID=103827 RepID=A0A0N5CVG3_THECL